MKQIIKDALIKVNQIRKVLGYKELDDLPKGIKGDCDECFIAKALNRQVSTETIYFEAADNLIKLENIGLERKGTSFNFVNLPEIKLAIREFDAGRLEEYELNLDKEQTNELIEVIKDIITPNKDEDKPFNFT